MRFVQLLLIVIVTLFVAAIGYAYSGLYNPAATAAHTPIADWYLHTMMTRGMESRAADLTAPDLNSPVMIKAGAVHYAEMCAGCHLAPDKRSSEIREGLNPMPADLPRIAKHLDPRDFFWVVKHGVRMTGMPALGMTHSDQDIWAITAFVRQLADMSPEQYRQLTRKADPIDAGRADRRNYDLDDQPTIDFLSRPGLMKM